MVINPPRNPLLPYAIGLTLAGLTGLAAWKLMRTAPEQHPAARIIRYAPDTLPRDAIGITLTREGDQYRTSITLALPEETRVYGVYTTTHGPRIGTINDWYETLTPEEKIALLARLARDAPSLAAYAYEDFRANWPSVKKDLAASLEELIRTLQHEFEQKKER